MSLWCISDLQIADRRFHKYLANDDAFCFFPSTFKCSLNMSGGGTGIGWLHSWAEWCRSLRPQRPWGGIQGAPNLLGTCWLWWLKDACNNRLRGGETCVKFQSQCSDRPGMQAREWMTFATSGAKIQQPKHSCSTINEVCARSLLWGSKQWERGLMHLSSSTHDSTEMFSVHTLDPTFICSYNLKVLFQGKWMPVNENEYATSWILGMCVQWFLLHSLAFCGR